MKTPPTAVAVVVAVIMSESKVTLTEISLDHSLFILGKCTYTWVMCDMCSSSSGLRLIRSDSIHLRNIFTSIERNNSDFLLYIWRIQIEYQTKQNRKMLKNAKQWKKKAFQIQVWI